MKKQPKDKKLPALSADEVQAAAQKAIDETFTGKLSFEEKGDALLNFARVYGGVEVGLMESYRSELAEIKNVLEEINKLQSTVDEQFRLAKVHGQLHE